MNKQQKILIVDDKKENLVALRKVLEGVGPGVEVIEASTGNDALTAAINHQFALALLDVHMPGMNGYELAGLLRGDKSLRVFPIIFLTAAYSDEQSVFKGYESGAVDYITKPYLPEALVGKVRVFLELDSTRRELETHRERLEDLVVARTQEFIKEHEQHKLTGRALAASETRYSDLFSRMNEGFALHEMITGPDGRPADYRFLEVNDAFEASTGLKRENLIGRTMREALPGLEPRWLEEYGRVALEQTTAKFEAYAGPLGRFYAVNAFSPQPGQFATIFTDITERKLAEIERERLIKAIEQAAEAVVITDPSGNIQYVNPAFERITGYAKQEALRENPRFLKSGRQDAAFYAAMWKEISAGRNWEGRMINKRKDGKLYTEEMTISPVQDSSGTILNFVAVKRDITEQLRLESQLLQSQKMEAIGVLAGGVAHDFNNILTAIKAYGEFIQKGLSPDSPLHSDAIEILTAADRAVNLTRQLLAFSRRQILAPRVIDMNTIVRDMSKMLRRLIGENIDIKVEFSRVPCLVNVDPGQMEQVLLNMAVNARDAMPKGGTLTVETGIRVPGEAQLPGDCLPTGKPLVCLTVKDTGCGMTEDVKSRIFEPFFTTKPQGKGTGLGLSTVFGIVKQSGGEITVESAPGQGCAFRVFLPLAETAVAGENPGAPSAEPAKARSGETVLLVEDDPILRRLGERILKENGYEVFVAARGEDAIELLTKRGKPVDLLLTDVVMPGISGRELSKELARQKLADRTIFMSGYTEDAIVDHGMLDQGIAFIYKPFNPDVLTKKLREVLDGPAENACP